MAAGRHGGYRDNEFRDRESDFNVSRREFSFPNSDYDRIRNGDRNHGRGRFRNQGKGDRDRVRVRGKDIKERELSNGGYRSASSRSDSGSSGSGANRSQFSVGAMDREPGELSSESGSDEAIDSESQVIVNDDLKLENTGSLPVESKKRKFSPIVWDRDDKEVSNTSRSSSVATSLPPPPPLPKSYRQSPTLILDGGVLISPVEDSNVQTLEPSPANPPVVTVLGLHVSDVSLSTVDLSSSPEEQRYANNYQEREAEQADDEDYIPTRKISASRWAADANSPVDEGEISDAEEMPKRRKKTPLSESMEMKIRSKSLTPEPGELDREGSEGARARSSESDGGYHARSSSGDDYPMDNSYKNDYMEINEEQNNNCIRVSRSHAESENEHDSHGTPEPVITSKRTVNMLKACRSVDVFEKLNKIDEGTYGVVYRAKDMDSGDIVALKKVKMEKEREGFPLTSLREINILLSFHHPSIVDVKEVVVGSALDSIFMVMEYMDHDLKVFMETMKHPFSQSEVKCLMLQLLGGVKYLHDNWVLHRDLKTSNLLLNNQGELKICDFGLARQYGSPLKPYTHLVVTLWYRAPELLLGAKQYSTAIDMWSLGCIMAELLSKAPLFNGKTEFDQLDKIFKILGTPNETIWPGFSKLPGVKVNFVKHQYNLLRRKFPATSFTGSPVLSDAGFDLLNKLLTYDPEKRITAEDALNHEWFREVPLPKSKEFMPTFPAQHEEDRRLRSRRVMKSPDPLEEQRRKELQQGEVGTGGLFG
ncbi:cyclin-dependent kinase G-2-like [Rhododendron vialii]|uniref:cyclin-dependent kinase G-2-like n=1 Tax=Rhododendron vialii TaxID=182163 RepID=UPI00265FFB48|nr:cyclin-dependent kinase G-2-like [Rhododendron vialii]